MATSSMVKIDANRENALKSTGPKDTSITRLNAMKHGLLTKELILDGENRKTLRELGKRLRADLAPQGELEIILVERIISSIWRLRRAVQVERDYLQSKYDDAKYDRFDHVERDDDLAWRLVVTSELGNSNTWLNLSRYEAGIEKQIFKALHELQRLQGARKGEKPPAPVVIDVDIASGS